MIVKVLINTTVKKLNKVYDYNVPDKLQEYVSLGKRVKINFGVGRASNVDGIIVRVEKNKTKEDCQYKLKDIIEVLDDVSYIDENKLALAKYISYTCFCNVYDVLKLMLPPGTASNNSSKNMSDKYDILIHLAKDIDIIEDNISSNIIKSPKHISLLRFLEENSVAYLDDIVSGLGISKAVINSVEKNGYIILEKVPVQNDNLSIKNIVPDIKKTPTNEQAQAIEMISSEMDKNEFSKFLIHGITGSGKTEVYMQVIEKVILSGKKVIFLVPEISLTHQTVIRLVSRFGNKVAVLHSKMKISERKEEYKKIAKGEVDIVIGARSAIFAPVKNLGLVILDEEHDQSYYSQTKPKYSTKEVAEYLCYLTKSTLILGSATPEVVTYYNAKNSNTKLITMNTRPEGAVLPEVQIVDLKEERLLGNKSIISNKLKEEILNAKSNNNQSMVFLNKRGYNSYYKCNDCSYIFKCPNCDIALTYHKKTKLLHCHYCSYVENNINMCPVCGSSNILVSTIGTEKLEEELLNISDSLKVLRMDADTTIARDSLNNILDKFRNKEADLLLGTQMISKGHDFPDVTIVGILGVDNLLAFSEYTSAERAYQNLSQVAGRAGRSKKQGKVIIETSDVDNYIIEAVKKHDYNLFYQNEIKYRSVFEYPPFCDILLFEMSSTKLELLKKEAIRLYQILNEAGVPKEEFYKIFSPKAPHVQKLNNKYRINIIIKTKLNKNIYKLVYDKLDKYLVKKPDEVILTVSKNPITI